MKETVNDRFRKFYESKGMGQKEFSEKIGASQQYISAIINNRRNVGPNIIKRLKSAFDDFNEYWLLTGNREKQENINPENSNDMDLLNENNRQREEINFLKDQIKKKDQQIEELFRIINADNSKTKGRSTA